MSNVLPQWTAVPLMPGGIGYGRSAIPCEVHRSLPVKRGRRFAFVLRGNVAHEAYMCLPARSGWEGCGIGGRSLGADDDHPYGIRRRKQAGKRKTLSRDSRTSRSSDDRSTRPHKSSESPLCKLGFDSSGGCDLRQDDAGLLVVLVFHELCAQKIQEPAREWAP